MSDGNRVDMLRVETVTQPRHAGGDFVELDAFLASIWYIVSDHVEKRKDAIWLYIPRFFTYMMAL